MPLHDTIHVNSIFRFLDPKVCLFSLVITYMREIYSSNSVVHHVNCLHAEIYLLTVIVNYRMFWIIEDDFIYISEFDTLYLPICKDLDEVKDIC
jgi:hypothetical protein